MIRYSVCVLNTFIIFNNLYIHIIMHVFCLSCVEFCWAVMINHYVSEFLYIIAD